MDRNIYETAEKILLAMLEKGQIISHHYGQTQLHVNDEQKLQDFNQFAVKQVMIVYSNLIEELRKIKD